MRSGALVLVLLVGALLIPGGAAAGSTPRASPRAVVEAASSTWVVVHDTRSTKPVATGAGGGAFEATMLVGEGCELSPRTSPPWRPGAPVSLVGESIVQPAPDDGVLRTVHGQQGCDRFTDGTPGLAGGERYLSSAPGGFLVRSDTGDDGPHLIWYRPGSAIALRPPFPGSTSWTPTVGDSGLVAVSKPSTAAAARIRFMPWQRPGSWTAVFTAAPRAALTCTPPSATHVVCTEQGRGPVLLALDGRARVRLRAAHPEACRHVAVTTAGRDLVAIETSDAGTCTAGRLLRLSDRGGLLHGSSSRRYSVPASVRGGLGGILVSTSDQRYVLRLKTVTDTGTIVWPAQGY